MFGLPTADLPHQALAPQRASASGLARRHNFYALHHIDEHPETLNGLADTLAAQLSALDPGCLPDTLLPARPPADWTGWPELAAIWAADRRAAIAAALPGDVDPGDVLRYFAPMLAVDGSWLQFAARPVDGHTRLSSALLGCYAQRVAGPHVGALFLELLARLGAPLPPVGTWAFASHPELEAAPFETACLLLGISHFPGRFRAELVGITLFAAAQPLHPIVAALGTAVRGRFGAVPYLDHLGDAGVQAAIRARAIAAATIALEDSSDVDATWARIRRGFGAAGAVDAADTAAILALADPARRGPRARMARLIQRKSAFAVGYHGARRLAGESLDHWFAAAGHDIDGFLDALAASPYVRPGEPRRSTLLTTAVAPRGAMAGIFAPDEIAVIRAWIESLPTAAAEAAPVTPKMAIAPPPAVDAAEPRPSGMARPQAEDDRRFATLPLRDLYWHLLHIEDYPELRGQARRFAASWLARAGAGMDKGARAIPFANYEPAALEAWLERQHAEQVASYRPDDTAPLPSREAVIDDAVQLCPMVLIDGAWLQHVGQVAFSATPVGRLLYRIYLDEVGDGDPRENHPNVYRELMDSMGVALPELGSREFAHWPRFKDAAFAVPTFWLAVSLFPKHFLPEVLGLNLAMELSGVGGTYRASRDALRRHGFSSAFVDLHNTVDNASTGHTAMALQAITTHLHDMLEAGGREEVQRRWRRVWTGYRALTPPPGFA